MIDSARWTGRPSEVRRATGPYGEIVSEAQEHAIWRDYVWDRRKHRLSAIAMLWGPAIVDKARTRGRSDDATVYCRQRGEEWTFGRAILASVAIVLNRMHGRREAVLHKRRTGISYIPSLDMGHWDATQDGYGYSVMCCQLYPGARVEIFSDGESWL